jgi:glycosyltransferase involved in cell wall biosynthesis
MNNIGASAHRGIGPSNSEGSSAFDFRSPDQPITRSPDLPLVSAVCVTADRREFVRAAIACFVAQDYPEKELVVIDDGRDRVGDLCAAVPRCRYVALDGEKRKIGVKRNLGAEAAAGEILCHWDDDDWSAPSRIRDQVERMLASGKAVSGYHSMLFWDGTRAFRYKGPLDYSVGSALCYQKDFWRRHAFVAEDHRRWEDNVFVQDARNERQIVCADAEKLMVARIHAANTCPKKPAEAPLQWAAVDPSEVPEGFFEASFR